MARPRSRAAREWLALLKSLQELAFQLFDELLYGQFAGLPGLFVVVPMG